MSTRPAPDLESGIRTNPALDTPIPAHLRARLQALAAVKGQSVAEVLDRWIDREMETLDEARREVADRIASAALATGSRD